MDVAGRWLPEGVSVKRAGDGVRLRGGEHDGREFDSVRDLQQFVWQVYPELRPERRA